MARYGRRPQIEKRLREGQTQTYIANSLGVTRSYVHLVARDMGITTKRLEGVYEEIGLHLTPEQIDFLDALYGRRQRGVAIRACIDAAMKANLKIEQYVDEGEFLFIEEGSL